MTHLYSTTPVIPRIITIGVSHPGETLSITQEYLDELALLAHTRGFQVVGSFIQKLDNPSSKTYIGKGKVEEIRGVISENSIATVIFDDNLTPSQVKNLEKEWECTVWDRSLLILDIFAMRAQTAQARVQVELAQYQYLLPRLTGLWSHHSRQKGGTKLMKGPGEKELETDKRIAQGKIHLLKQQLAAIERQSLTQRKQRSKYVNVALVGYTNAGKSSLMRQLAKADVVTEDKLFATLSTTVRKVVLNHVPFLLADTVGFIRKLPHALIESFKSTLMEVKSAHLLLHVVDASHRDPDRQIITVKNTLKEIGADHIPSLLIFNKRDKLQYKGKLLNEWDKPTQNEFLKKSQKIYEKRFQYPVIFTNSLTKEGIQALQKILEKHVYKHYIAIYPHSKATNLG
ncbi:MAG: GTPase HflX [Bacteroidota bacterium]